MESKESIVGGPNNLPLKESPSSESSNPFEIEQGGKEFSVIPPDSNDGFDKDTVSQNGNPFLPIHKDTSSVVVYPSSDVVSTEDNPFTQLALNPDLSREHDSISNDDSKFPSEQGLSVSEAGPVMINPFTESLQTVDPSSVVAGVTSFMSNLSSGVSLPPLPIEEDSKARLMVLCKKLKGLSGSSEKELAEIYLSIGMELQPHIVASKISFKDSQSSALKIFTEVGFDISNATLSSILKLSQLPDIDKYCWLGWKNMVLMNKLKVKKDKNIHKFDSLLAALYDGSSPPTQATVDVDKLHKKASLYSKYRHLCSKCRFKTNRSLNFTDFERAVTHGIMFDKALIEELQKRKRPDNYIKSLIQGAFPPAPLNVKTVGKEIPLEDTLTLIIKLTNNLKERISGMVFTTHIPEYILEELVITTIDYFDQASDTIQFAEAEKTGEEVKIFSRRAIFSRVSEHLQRILERDL